MGGYEVFRKRLSAREVAVLAAFGLIPPFSLEEIKERSKAEAFTKALAALQGLWMVVQVIERQRLGLPVTPLEFSAALNVVCGMVAYLLWFRKPQDLQLATQVKVGKGASLTSDWKCLLSVKTVAKYNTSHPRSAPIQSAYSKAVAPQLPSTILQWVHTEDGDEGPTCGKWSILKGSEDATEVWATPDSPESVTVLGFSILIPRITAAQILSNTAVSQPAVRSTAVEHDRSSQQTVHCSVAHAGSTKDIPTEILINFETTMPINLIDASFLLNFCLDSRRTCGPMNTGKHTRR